MKHGKYLRLEETRKQLILKGVDPKVVEEAFQAALHRSQRKGCPTAVSQKIGKLLTVGISILVTQPDEKRIEIEAWEGKRKRKDVVKFAFTPQNWSLPRKK